jgi:hypothetical protein
MIDRELHEEQAGPGLMGCIDSVAGTRPCCLVLGSLVFLFVLCYSTLGFANTLSQTDAMVIGEVAGRFKAVGKEILEVGGSITDLNDMSASAAATATCLLTLQQQVLILSMELNEAMWTTAIASLMRNREDESAVISVLRVRPGTS